MVPLLLMVALLVLLLTLVLLQDVESSRTQRPMRYIALPAWRSLRVGLNADLRPPSCPIRGCCCFEERELPT